MSLPPSSSSRDLFACLVLPIVGVSVEKLGAEVAGRLGLSREILVLGKVRLSVEQDRLLPVYLFGRHPSKQGGHEGGISADVDEGNEKSGSELTRGRCWSRRIFNTRRKIDVGTGQSGGTGVELGARAGCKLARGRKSSQTDDAQVAPHQQRFVLARTRCVASTASI